MKKLFLTKSLLIAIPALLLFGVITIVPSLHLTPYSYAGSNDLNCNEDLSEAGKELFCGGNSTVQNDSSSLSKVINTIANWLVGIIGSVLAVVILVSAVQIVTAGGSPEAMKSAKNRLTQAAISLGLLVSFRAIVALIGL